MELVYIRKLNIEIHLSFRWPSEFFYWGRASWRVMLAWAFTLWIRDEVWNVCTTTGIRLLGIEIYFRKYL